MELLFKEFLEMHQQRQMKRLAIFDFDGTLGRVPGKPMIGSEAQKAMRDNETAKNELRRVEKNEKSTQKQKEEARQKCKVALELVKKLLNGWDGKDWWGHPASLSQPNYNNSFNDSVLEAFRQAKHDPNTHVAMITGRRSVIAPEVRKVLQQQGLFGKRRIHPDNIKALEDHESHPNEDQHHAHDEFYSGDFHTDPTNPASKETWEFKRHMVENKLMHAGIEIIETWDDREDHIPNWQSLGKEMLKKWPNLKTFIIHKVENTQNGHYVIDIPVNAGD